MPPHPALAFAGPEADTTVVSARTPAGGWRATLGHLLGLDASAQVLAWLATACCGLGLVMVYSASAIVAERDPRLGDPEFFVRRQAVAIGLGLAVMWVLARLRPETWRRLAPLALVLGIVGLVAVLVPGVGHAANGARRWVRIAGFGWQPSDFARVALVVWLARCAASRAEGHPRAAVVAAGSLLGIVGLIAIEPDIGTATATAAVGGAMLFVSGVSWRRLALVVGLGAPLAAMAAYQTFPHVRARVDTFLANDGHGAASHQVRQSLIALGAGGATGVGLGAGRQKLQYLPEESTDFILAEVGEELGFAGTACTVGLFLMLLLHGASVARRARDPFGAVLATGVTLLITSQAAANVAVVTGLAPTKGIALPFVSAGGSGAVALAAAMGALIAVARATDRGAAGDPVRPRFGGPPTASDSKAATPVGGPAHEPRTQDRVSGPRNVDRRNESTQSLPAVARVAAFDAAFEGEGR